MMVTIRARWRTILDIETFNQPRVIPLLRRIGLPSSGRINQSFGGSAQDQRRALMAWGAAMTTMIVIVFCMGLALLLAYFIK
jgi:hypothetical protein